MISNVFCHGAKTRLSFTALAQEQARRGPLSLISEETSNLNRTKDNFARQSGVGLASELSSYHTENQLKQSRGEIPNFCPMRALCRREVAAAREENFRRH